VLGEAYGWLRQFGSQDASVGQMKRGGTGGVVPGGSNSGAEPGPAPAGLPTGQAPSSGALTAAIHAALAGAGIPALAAGARRLTATYRSGDAPVTPVLAKQADAVAYAAYRMPATAAAMALALQQTRLSLPAWRPATLLDFGAGTGSVAWAAAAQLPSVEAMTLLEQSAAAISVGRAILEAADALGSAGGHGGSSRRLIAADTPAPRAVTFRTWRLPAGQPDVDQAAGRLRSQPDDLPTADLATVSYVLGELTDAQQAAMMAVVVRAAPAIVLIEPGTPAGHLRILLARERLLASGYQLAAPCPHSADCPLAAVGDWCHFAARLPRSPVHRQVKGAELGYEDEKFSYVAAVRPGLLGPGSPSDPVRPTGRIVRRPQQRKNLVTLEVCRRDGTAGPDLIGKSARETYREARKVSWGDRWDHPAPCRAAGPATR
jgi:ribosomal protein RSM22 (predicted rRNA methylase)